MGTQSLGSIWKGRAWDDGNPVPRTTLPDGSLAEAMAAIGYAWNATAGAFQKLTVDNATGGLNVTVVSGAVTTGGLTDTQLRATAVPISAASLPLPTGAATDSSITAALGSSTATDVPSAWTALDQLNRIRKLETQNVSLLTQLVALQTPKPVVRAQTTLLHRS